MQSAVRTNTVFSDYHIAVMAKDSIHVGEVLALNLGEKPVTRWMILYISTLGFIAHVG